MQRLLDNLIEQGVVEDTDSEALASLIYGSLAEAAFWIAEGDQGAARLERANSAMELMLRGLLVQSS